MKISRNYFSVILFLLLVVSLVAWGGCGGKETTNGRDGSATDHGEGKPRVILFTQPG